MEVEQLSFMVESKQDLIGDAELFLKYKLAARTRVVEKFSIIEMVQQLENIYQSATYGN